MTTSTIIINMKADHSLKRKLVAFCRTVQLDFYSISFILYFLLYRKMTQLYIFK